MKTTSRNILVLICHEDTIVAAQAHTSHERFEITRTATLKLPESVTWEDADQFGQTFRRFLHQKQLSAKSVIVGVPARWIIAKTVSIPPTSPENVSSLLEIQTEQAFSINSQDLVFDYSGRISATESNEVFLVAMQRRRLIQIRALTKTAGLKLLAVTPFAAAMSLLSSGTSSRMCGVYTQNEHCEFVAVTNGTMRQIKHLSKSLSLQNPDIMASEIQRVLLLARSEESTEDPVSLVLWSDEVDSSQATSQLQKNLGSHINIREGRSVLAEFGRERLGQVGPEYECAAGVLLAYQRDVPFIDFLNSHMGVKSKKNTHRLIVWLTFAILILVIGFVGVLWEWQQDRQVIQVYEQYIHENKDNYEATHTLKDSLALATGWSVGRPRYLDCLSGLALAFPERGDIWVTNMSLKEDATGLITGGAIDRPAILNVIDKLKQSDRFSYVEMHYIHGGGSDGVSYTIEFRFVSDN